MRKEPTYIISVDVGTSSAKTMLYEVGVAVRAQRRAPYPTYYPEPGAAEQDPEEVLGAVVGSIRGVVEEAGVAPASVAAVVMGGIWQSLVPVDAEGRPLCRATTWADLRATPQNEALRGALDNEAVKSSTGCTLHPMYFPARLLRLKEEAPGIFARADRFVSIKEYLLGRLFGSRLVDRAMASGTGVWNMRTMDWDRDLLGFLGLEASRFSDCVEPTSFIAGGLRGEFALPTGLLAGTPAVIGGADGAMAHLGSAGLVGGRMSLSVGTSVALRLLSSEPRVVAGSDAWCYYLAEGRWLVGGVMHDGGNTLTWLADTLLGDLGGGANPFEELSRLADSVEPGANGLLFMPYFGGERSPRYRPESSGTIHGLRFNHTRAHIARSLMEGLSYCIDQVYRMLSPDGSADPVVTGGIQKSKVWMGIVAAFLGKPLLLPAMEESAAWGGVVVGSKAVGAIEDLAEASTLVKIASRLEPDPALRDAYSVSKKRFEELYARLYGG